MQTLPNNNYQVSDSGSVLITQSSSTELCVCKFKNEEYDYSHKIEFLGQVNRFALSGDGLLLLMMEHLPERFLFVENLNGHLNCLKYNIERQSSMTSY